METAFCRVIPLLIAVIDACLVEFVARCAGQLHEQFTRGAPVALSKGMQHVPFGVVMSEPFNELRFLQTQQIVFRDQRRA